MGNSVVTGNFDAEAAFRAPGTAAITSTANSSAVAIDYMDYARGLYADTHGKMTYEIFIVVTALDTADADETYTLNVRVGTDASMTSATAVAEVNIGSTGQFKVLVDRDTLEKTLAGATHMDIRATLAGTTPSLTYYAWVA